MFDLNSVYKKQITIKLNFLQNYFIAYFCYLPIEFRLFNIVISNVKNAL